LRGVRVTIVAVVNHMYYTFSVCGCRLRCPAWNAHAPYCLLWRVWLYYIFHIISQEAQKKVIEQKMFVSIFSAIFVW